MTLTIDLLTSKVLPESRVTCATSVPIFVFLGLSVLDLGPMYLPSPPLPTSSPLRIRPLKSSYGVWGSAVGSPNGVWGGAPAEIDFDAF